MTNGSTPVSQLFERIVDLPRDRQHLEIEAIRDRDPATAAELEELLAVEGDAEAWFSTLEEELDEQRYAELDAAWAPGQTVGPYRLERLVGAGGMGAVFLARKADGELKRPVALKLIPPGSLPDDEWKMLRRERDTLAALGHPNIAQLFDAGVDDDGQPWFAMEYIEGLALTEWVRRQECSGAATLELFQALCSAVSFAHRHLVVHGDVKPANVMVDRYGRVKLLDFGISRLILASGGADGGTRYLSPAYAAPELREGRAVSVSSDIFALGMVLRELLESGGSRRNALSPELKAIIARACAPDPDHRYESVSQMVSDLADFGEGRPVRAYAGGPGYRFRKWLRRHAVGAVLGAVMIATILGFAVVSRYQAEIYQRERDKATQLSGFLRDVFVSADPEFAQGHEMTARELLDRGVHGIERVSADPSVRNEFLLLMGRTYRGLGDFEQARDLFSQALSLQRNELDAPTAMRAATLVELGQTAHANGRLEESEARYREAMALLDPARGGDDALLRARALGKYGRMLSDTGRLDEGLEHIERAVKLTRRHGEEGSVDLAERLNDLGSSYFRRGQHDEALESLEEALVIRRELDRRSERSSPRTATIINNVGLMYYLSGLHDPAERSFEEALTMRREILPDNHPDTAQTLTNYGLLLKDEGRHDESVAMLREALEIREASLRPDHLRIGQAMHNLAIAHHKNGDFDRARQLFVDAIEQMKGQLGERHPVIAIANNDYAALLFEMGELKGAETHYRTAQRIRNETLPPDHPHVAWSLSGLGRVLMRQGRYREAIPLLEQALAIREGKLPPGDALIAEVSEALEVAHGHIDVD